MKKLGFVLFILAMTLALAGSALAQIPIQGDQSLYFVTYFANNISTAPDGTVRVINDGLNSANIWADFFVFDDSEELTQCCSCVVTPDGLLSESVRNQLTKYPLTSIVPTRGVIKVIASAIEFDKNTNFAGEAPIAGLHGWATHNQSTANKYPTGGSPYYVTETELADASLAAPEQALLEELCKFDNLLSGKPCTCTLEDNDF